MPEVRYVGLAALQAKAMAAVEVAVTEAAHDLVRRSQAATPVKTGTLQASIHVAGVTAGGSSVTAKIATGAEANLYAVMVHEGTGPHVIKARNARALSFNGITVKSVHHPGTRAYRYMTRPLLQMAPTYKSFIATAAQAQF